MNAERHFVVGISGASGMIYGIRMLEAMLADPDVHVHATVTNAGQRVMLDELPDPADAGPQRSDGAAGLILSYMQVTDEQAARLHGYACADIGARPASGTFQVEAMLVAPCSMNTLASIANGLQSNLLTRAAAVTLKEGRPLLLMPRETPLGLIELRNMVAAAEAGAIILPADPGFYHRPETIEDLVRFIVQKILDRIGIEMPGALRWEGTRRGERSKASQ